MKMHKNELVEFVNQKDEKVVIDLSVIQHERGRASGLMSIWVSKGLLPEFLDETINIEVYAYDKDGNCWGRYNPQVTEDNKTSFKWILENTEENRERIIEEVKRLAS